MSRAYSRYPAGSTFDLPEGGLVRSGGDVYAPALTATTPIDVGFGPVAVGTPEDSLTQVSSLSYVTGSESDLPILGVGVGIGGVAAGSQADRSDLPDSPPNPSMTRRAVLGLTAGLIATAGTAEAASDDETVELGLATFTIDKSTGPVSVRVLDIVDEVLPTTTDILVDAEDVRVGEVADPAEGVTLPQSTTGEVTIYLQDARGKLQKLWAWLRSLVGGDAGIDFKRKLPKPAAEYAEGDFVKLSSHNSLVQPVEAAPDDVRLRIGSTTIPHESAEETAEVGSFGVFDGDLVYVVGSSPPNSADWRLETNLGLLTRVTNTI